MSIFKYRGYTIEGKVATGTVESTTLETAFETLRTQEIYPSIITPVGDQTPWKKRMTFQRQIRISDIALFTRRLATLLEASVPLHESLSALAREERNRSFKIMLGDITVAVSEGASLSAALNKAPNVFRENYRAMVAAGEAGGALADVLEKLADFLEHQEHIQRSVMTASIYPLLMAGTGTAVILFLLTFVIPQITSIFSQNNAALPFITIGLLFVSSTLRKGWWIILLFLVGISLLYKKQLESAAFRGKRDALLLKIPLIGNLISTLALAQLTRTLSLLLASGVPLLQALDISTKALTNQSYRSALIKTQEAVAEGIPLSVALGSSPLFPGIVTHLISVGERSGSLEHTLQIVATRYEKEFEESTKRYLNILEPVMILVMGLVVELVVIAVLLPIFQLNQLIM